MPPLSVFKEVNMVYYIQTIDSNVVSVTTDDDAIGEEVRFDSDVPEDEQALIALTEYLGYEPKEVLCLDGIVGIKYEVTGGNI